MYPVLLGVAWILALFAESTASVHALPRPMIVGIVLIAAIQAGTSLLSRGRHSGAALVLLLELTLVGLWPVALLAAAVLVIWLFASARQRRSSVEGSLAPVTRGLDVVSAIMVGLALVSVVGAGALAPPERLGASPVGRSDATLPDIYLILLDGYPRADTLVRQFDYDNEPFLAEMRARGFTVAENSRSNYNATELTLASMFNASRVADLPAFAQRSSSPQSQSRALTRSIAQGTVLDALRSTGYEIVTLPSDVSAPTLFGADRTEDSGHLTSFEYEILQEGLLPAIMPGPQRSWLTGQHRNRIEATFERLGAIAAERVDHPRFVFAHVMAPHAPIVFGPDGALREGWPCFPVDCSIFYGGQEYGDGILGPIRDQLASINASVINAADEIQNGSKRPPVIVFFSDHGQRHDLDDPDEMLRSLFVSATPAQTGLFPDDVTPVNIVPRLLEAYAGVHLPLAPETFYVVDMRKVETTGIMDIQPWSPRD